MVRRCLILGLILGAIMLILVACAAPRPQQPWGQFYPYGPGGMMGPGMMGPGMMGPHGMVGGWGRYNPDARQITIDEAAQAATRYLLAYYGKQLVVTEVMDFAWNYYAEVKEVDTGIGAMELLIDKYSGQVYPEMGPNMMWNTKYGMMGSYLGTPSVNMPITAAKAREIAQKFLDVNLPGFSVGEAEVFYGYYTLHTLKNGTIQGMLSVNGYDGSVWYHNWHGPFIAIKEYAED